MPFTDEQKEYIQKIARHSTMSEATKARFEAETAKEKLEHSSIKESFKNMVKEINKKFDNHEKVINLKFEGFSDFLEEQKKINEKYSNRIEGNTKWRYLTVGGLTVISIIVVPLFLDLIKDKMAKAQEPESVEVVETAVVKSK